MIGNVLFNTSSGLQLLILSQCPEYPVVQIDLNMEQVTVYMLLSTFFFLPCFYDQYTCVRVPCSIF